MRSYSKLSSCWLVLVLLCPALVFAGSFKVLPLKITLDSQTKTTLFKVINTDEQAVIVQLQIVDWEQDEQGEDVFNKTREMVLFPKIVKLAAGEERIIRIGYQAGGSRHNHEKNYRILAQELPQQNLPGGILKFALRFSVPVFITPDNVQNNYTIAQSSLQNGRLKIDVSNNGNTHIVVKKIIATGVDDNNQEVFNLEDRGWYVLPGVIKPFYINLPAALCQFASRLEYTIQIEDKFHKKSMTIPSSSCRPDKVVNNTKL